LPDFFNLNFSVITEREALRADMIIAMQPNTRPNAGGVKYAVASRLFVGGEGDFKPTILIVGFLFHASRLAVCLIFSI
jgi:hypothetical protein